MFMETEKLLQKFKHPDPYKPPSAPGGAHEMTLPTILADETVQALNTRGTCQRRICLVSYMYTNPTLYTNKRKHLHPKWFDVYEGLIE